MCLLFVCSVCGFLLERPVKVEFDVSTLKRGLKKLPMNQSGSDSGASESSSNAHPQVDQFIDGEFPMLDFTGVKLKGEMSSFMDSPELRSLYTSSKEITIQFLIVLLLNSFLCNLGIDNELCVELEVAFCSGRHDIDVLLKHVWGVIKAIIEVGEEDESS